MNFEHYKSLGAHSCKPGRLAHIDLRRVVSKASWRHPEN